MRTDSLLGSIRLTYCVHFFQVINMALLALLTPLLIGFTEYGIYVSIFALPGMAMGIIETMYVLGFSKRAPLKYDFLVWLILTITMMLVASVITMWIGNNSTIFYTLLLLFILSCKSFLYSIFINFYSKDVLFPLVSLEIISIVTYAIVLLLAFVLNIRDFRLPYFMVILSSITSIFVLIMKISLRNLTMATQGSVLSPFQYFFARTYEDGLFTLLPLFLANQYGLAFAGQYRYVVTFIRSVGKIFPVRYDFLARLLCRKGHDVTKKNICFLAGFIFVGLPVFFCYSLYEKTFLGTVNPFGILIAFSGGIIFSVTFIPIVLREYPAAIFVFLSLFVGVVVCTALVPVTFFVPCYLLITALSCVVLFFYLKRIIAKEVHCKVAVDAHG